MLSSEAGPSQRPRSTSRLERLRRDEHELEAIEASRKQTQARKERLLKDFEDAVRDEKALKAKYEELKAVRATDLPEVEGVSREKMRRDIVMMRLKQQPLIQPQPEHLSDECDRDEVEQWIEEVNTYYRAMHMAPEANVSQIRQMMAKNPKAYVNAQCDRMKATWSEIQEALRSFAGTQKRDIATIEQELKSIRKRKNMTQQNSEAISTESYPA